MAGELQANGPGPGRVCYALVRSAASGAEIWNTLSGAFVPYVTAGYAGYPVSLVEQGAGSNYYVGNFPAAVPAGVFSVTGKQQAVGSPAETDATFAFGDFNWDGSAPVPLSNLATSGQVGQIAPLRVARGTMVAPFNFKMVSAADHVTPFLSGILSGQIARDSGAFGPLQSGAFTEQGLGYYSLQALTSGDLLANAVSLTFTAAGVSGGAADSRDFTFILQRTSGQ